MKCVDPPEFEVSWAEGHAHAWLCEKHLKKFVKDSFDECIKAGEEIINCASDRRSAYRNQQPSEAQ
jgi:hypothetical protein